MALFIMGLRELRNCFNFRYFAGVFKDVDNLNSMVKLQDEPGMKEKIVEGVKLVIKEMAMELVMIILLLIASTYFIGTWMFVFLVSTLALSFLSKYLRKKLSTEDYRIYWVADHIYCAAVYIVGPFVV